MREEKLGKLTVRLARSDMEVIAAQKLRYRVFYEGMGARPTELVEKLRMDIDPYDAICDHLLVIENEADPKRAKIVGTYRLLRKSIARKHEGFYSADEFDLSALQNYPGEHVELGRSCVDPLYRGKAIMQLLWRGIADYLKAYDISLMFGCASFPGTDVCEFSSALTYLNRFHKAPKEWRPVAVDNRYISMKRMTRYQLDVRQAMREMPALIKGYLRVGGVVGKGAVIDYQFNTIDICLMVETTNITGRYQRHFMQSQPNLCHQQHI
ncbi:GNAT family N-acetyltransferase [Sneathiella glossodoripedis]|uniref:GNAT family N-acetyltransferase n=1 Tax=Sneathiella glossodoripedis TaxID=418853 RepID=UPI000471E372|nr:GNAT family N-acyltransferase [Sneathiella glossodoripedis]